MKIDPEDLKKEVKVATQKPEEKRVEVPVALLSQDDVYLHELIKNQPTTVEQIEIQNNGRSNPLLHRLSLPAELNQFESKFSFRWVNKHRRAISEAIQNHGWTVVNRRFAEFVELPDYIFSTNGAIERGDTILMFIPKKKAEDIRREASILSREAVDARLGAHKGNPNFYVPKDDEDDRVIGL